jgi:hypothetical protein
LDDIRRVMFVLKRKIYWGKSKKWNNSTKKRRKIGTTRKTSLWVSYSWRYIWLPVQNERISSILVMLLLLWMEWTGCTGGFTKSRNTTQMKLWCPVLC